MTSTEAFNMAKTKARYSPYDWVVWKNKTGAFTAKRATYETIKEALLTVGTQGTFNIIQARTAWSHLCTWRIGINEMRYRKKGWIK